MMKTKNILQKALAICEAQEYDGVCIACGHVQSGCEPDARKYECESCGENKVYGAEEIIVCGY